MCHFPMSITEDRKMHAASHKYHVQIPETELVSTFGCAVERVDSDHCSSHSITCLNCMVWFLVASFGSEWESTVDPNFVPSDQSGCVQSRKNTICV